jgi:PAS domain S-box-containing protein
VIASRREGNDVLFLSEHKAVTNAPLNHRIPLSRTDAPTVMAVLGRTGIVEGHDVHGTLSLLADIRSVPDSPWFLVARIDIAEVNLPLKPNLWTLIVAATAMLWGSGAFLAFLWRHQSSEFFKKQAQMSDALLKSEDKYRVLFDCAGDAIFIHREVEMLAVNQMACERLGYSRAELMSMAIGALDAPEQSRYVPERIARLVEHGTITFETAHLRKDGSPVPTEVNARLITWDGEPALMSICRDIAERELAEDALARLSAQIQAKNTELEQLVYVASHDLRSPLVNIEGWGREAEYAIDELNIALAAGHASSEALQAAVLQPVQEMSAALRYIRGSTTQMDALLTGLLKVSRYGRTSLTIVPLNMNELIAEVVAAMEFQVKAAGVELQVGELPPCRGDAMQVSQVFTNLLGNAIKYRDPDHFSVVRIGGVIDGPRSVYSVEDNGIGIAPAHQEIIFEVFHRLEPSKSEGEGLGLTIVRQITGRLDGEVRVESKPGEGSRFSVALPVSDGGDKGRLG